MMGYSEGEYRGQHYDSKPGRENQSLVAHSRGPRRPFHGRRGPSDIAQRPGQGGYKPRKTGQRDCGSIQGLGRYRTAAGCPATYAAVTVRSATPKSTPYSMIVLDTNVLSELMRPRPDAQVLIWFDSQPRNLLATTSVTFAEILRGVGELPSGRRRERLRSAAESVFTDFFSQSVLPFDRACAIVFADIVVARRERGRPISDFDAQIASIVRQSGAALATRNTTDFAHCDIELINPWNTN
jgi:predicted nucleic acid-binding protein